MFSPAVPFRLENGLRRVPSATGETHNQSTTENKQKKAVRFYLALISS